MTQSLESRGRFFWKLFLANAAVMGLILSACVWIILAEFDRFYEQQVTRQLRAHASTLLAMVQDRFDPSHADELDRTVKGVGSRDMTDLRVTLVLADGRVLADSEADASRMESHLDRPEIVEALASGTGTSTRWSHTVSSRLKYMAVRVSGTTSPLGVVRVALPVQSIVQQSEPARRLMSRIAVTAVAAAVLLALTLALMWSRRIGRITEVAQSLSHGDLTARVTARGHDEVAELGRSLNRMRANLKQQLGVIDRQRRTLESLVSQLREGVVVADEGGRVVVINQEACRLLGLPEVGEPAARIGRPVELCVPQRRLQDLLGTGPGTAHDERNGGTEPSLSELRLQVDGPDGVRSLLARACNITLPAAQASEDAPASDRVGRLLMLSDITELAQMIQVKADFAANASHELRTPLAAIRAAIETLVSLAGDRDELRSFLHMIDRQSTRMEEMVRDLLELSRVESPAARFEPTSVATRSLLEELKATFADSLAAKQLNWTLDVAESCRIIVANPELLRIVLRNLIDNAIRFTDPGGHIVVSVEREGDGMVLRIVDDGCGIPQDAQRRVFERFYQVERARSGADRGTGLGLSIVRHAVAAMNGTVGLTSEPRKGTCVKVTIPQTS